MKTRFEIKFRLSRIQYKEMSDFFSFLMDRDPHTPEGEIFYPVLSLYFDTKERKFLYEKVNGEFEHNKIRIRNYGYNLLSKNLFLEHKLKKGSIMTKERLPFSEKIDLERLSFSSSSYFKQLLEKYEAYPSSLVYYDREAYEGMIEGEKIRLNFDYGLKYLSPNIAPFTEDVREERAQTDDSIILEIKSNREILPDIIQRKLKSLHCKRSSFSKYGSSLFMNVRDELIQL